MNKKDVLGIIEDVASDTYFNGFKIRKSDNSLIFKTDVGYKRITFNYYNSYDLDRGDLALEIRPIYGVRFNILHKWFEKYSKKSIRDQRDSYSIGFVGSMIDRQSEFYFLESRKDFEKDLRKIKMEVVENAKLIFSKFSKLEGYYEYCIGDVINNKRQLPNEGFDWVVEYLIATKVIDPSNYELVKGLVLQRVEYMKGRNNPNIKLYYPEIPTILKDLENTDFKEIEWTDSV